MATRIFKTTTETHNGYESVLTAKDSSEIKQYYGTYGTYYEGGTSISLEDTEVNEDGKHYIDVSNMQNHMISLFKNSYANDISEDENDDDIIIFNNLSVFDAFSTFAGMCYDNDGEYIEEGKSCFTFNSETKSFEETTIEEVCDAEYEAYQFWDGSNWQTVTVTGGYCDTDEITDEYPNWDNMELIASTPDVQGHSARYFLYKDDDKKIIIRENVTRWQGQQNDFSIIEDTDEIHQIVVLHRCDNIIDDEFPELLAIGKAENLRVAVNKNYNGDIIGQKIFDKSKATFIENKIDPNGFTGTDYWRTIDGVDVQYSWSNWQGSESEWLF